MDKKPAADTKVTNVAAKFPRKWLWAALVAAVVLASGGWVHAWRMSARLLSSEPDLLPANPVLLHYAVVHGGPTYQSYCLECHGAHGSGDPSRGVPALSDSDWLYGAGSVSDIERIVTYGIRSYHPKAWNLASMPAFGRAHPSASNPSIPPLAPAQIRDVIEFLRSAQRRTADNDAALRGAKVYQSVGACYDCHSPDAKGDSAIGAPNLADQITLYGDDSRAALYDSIANGRQGICPSWIGVLSALSIREVALYVYQLSHPGQPAHPG